MKKILFTLLLMVVGLNAYATQPEDGKAEITFEKVSHDFGTFSEDAPVVHCTFKFTNTGDALLVIHQAIASCGCTVPEYPKEPIKPGPRVKAMALSCSFSTPALFKASCTTGTIFCW